MKVLICLVLALSSLAGNLSTIVGAGGSSSGGISFVGYTTATYTGAEVGGIVGLNAKCQLEYSGSHMCFVDDFIKSGVSAPPANDAWILSTSANVRGIGGTGGNWVAHGCNGWVSDSSSSYAGTIAAGTGAYGVQTCNNSLRLTCCKL